MNAHVRKVLHQLGDIALPAVGWGLCRVLGLAAWHLTSRRAATLRNLHLAFPEKPPGWHEAIARQSVDRMFEMFLIPLLAPWLSERALDRRFTIRPETRRTLEGGKAGPVLIVPHSTMTETLVLLPHVAPRIPPITALYRPLDWQPANRYVLWARGRWGLRLHSRKEGLIEARNALRRNESLGVLFDQNAQSAGSLVLFFGRVCSATDLPGMLAAKTGKAVHLLYPRRTGFMRCEMTLLPFEAGTTPGTITARSAKRLEDEMRRKDAICADWLWAHQRWKLRDGFDSKLNLDQKKSYLDESLRLEGSSELPRRTPFCVRLPGEDDMARHIIHFLPRLRQARPDVFWIVVAPASICHELREGFHYDRLEPFIGPPRLPHVLTGLRELWVDTHFCLYPDADVARERKLSNARKVFGISSTGQRDKRGIALWKAPADLLEPEYYEKLAAAFFEACGLRSDANVLQMKAADDSRADERKVE